MPEIKIDTPSNLPAADTFSKLQSLFENDPELRKMDPSYSCQFDPQALSGEAKGKKFNASMKVVNSSVKILIKIPLLLSPLKGKIKTTVEKKLAKLLA